MPAPHLQVREWSTTTPQTPGTGAVLRGLRLSDADHELLADLQGRAWLRVSELRSGLAVETRSYVGTLHLSGLRLVVMPKMRIDRLMQMVAYAFELSDLVVTQKKTPYDTADAGSSIGGRL